MSTTYAYIQRIEQRSADKRQVFRVDYRCGHCDGVVDARHRWCPWCGRPFWSPGVTTQ